MWETLGISLLAMGLGAVGARVARVIRIWYRDRLISSFWRPALDGSTVIAYGEFGEDLQGLWDPAGLMGLGDALALVELYQFLRRRGFGFLRAFPASSLPPESLQQSLICIGGPSGNSVTRSILKRLSLPLDFPHAEEHVVTITDKESERDYEPSILMPSKNGTDYGMITRAPNPFNASRTVVILAGCFGFGSWAAAKWACEPNSWRDLGHKFEAKRSYQILLRIGLIDGFPAEINVELIREL